MRGDQLARQWRLIQLLGRRRYGVGLDEAAAELECNRRTVYRDLDALQYAGFPVTSEKREGRVFYRLIEGFELGEAPLTTDELMSLAVGEDLLKVLEGTPFHDSIRSAQTKIRASLGPELTAFVGRLKEVFDATPGPHKRYAQARDTIRTVNEAILNQRTVRIDYTTGRTGETATRELDPYRLWYRSGGLYVIGHDHKSGEIRTFAIDRIGRTEVQDAHFEVRKDFDFEARTASAFGVVADPPERVRIRFAPRRSLYVQEHEWHPSQTLSKTEDGGVELSMEVGVGEELRNWVLSFGADAEVLLPEALRREVAAELARARERYEDPTMASQQAGRSPARSEP